MGNHLLQHIKFQRFGPEKEELARIAHEIRHTVFVEEQSVPVEIEYDAFESGCQHYLMFQDGIPIATARWRFTAKGIKLERFAMVREHRNKGLGTLLLNEVLKDVIPLQRPIYLHAQVQAMNYYGRMGFVAEGPEFEEAGIRHYKMVLKSGSSPDSGCSS
jgi:predicted GNAT family N-acyltransferase